VHVLTAYAAGRETPDPVRLDDPDQMFRSLKLPDGYLRSGEAVGLHELRSKLTVAISVCETLLEAFRDAGSPSGEHPGLDQRVAESKQRERLWSFLNDYRRTLAVAEWAIASDGALALRQ
jgi:hypothetical protein